MKEDLSFFSLTRSTEKSLLILANSPSETKLYVVLAKCAKSKTLDKYDPCEPVIITTKINSQEFKIWLDTTSGINRSALSEQYFNNADALIIPYQLADNSSIKKASSMYNDYFKHDWVSDLNKKRVLFLGINSNDAAIEQSARKECRKKIQQNKSFHENISVDYACIDGYGYDLEYNKVILEAITNWVVTGKIQNIVRDSALLSLNPGRKRSGSWS